jgi:hypothetical protein
MRLIGLGLYAVGLMILTMGALSPSNSTFLICGVLCLVCAFVGGYLNRLREYTVTVYYPTLPDLGKADWIVYGRSEADALRWARAQLWGGQRLWDIRPR